MAGGQVYRYHLEYHAFIQNYVLHMMYIIQIYKVTHLISKNLLKA